MCHLGIWFSGGPGRAGLILGLNDLRDLFSTQRSHGLMILGEVSNNNCAFSPVPKLCWEAAASVAPRSQSLPRLCKRKPALIFN